MSDLLKYFDSYLYIQCNFSYYKCLDIFGKEMGEHLWPKWLQCEGNLIYFMQRLDKVNQEKLVKGFFQ